MPNTYLSWPRGVLRFIALEVTRKHFGDEIADSLYREWRGFNGDLPQKHGLRDEAIPEFQASEEKA